MALKLAVLIAALACTPALASPPPQHAGQRTAYTVRVNLEPGTKYLVLTRPIGKTAMIERVKATVNDHALTGWMEAHMTAGLGGYGVIVQITFTHRAGPAIVRMASARDTTAKVVVRIVFH